MSAFLKAAMTAVLTAEGMELMKAEMMVGSTVGTLVEMLVELMAGKMVDWKANLLVATLG